MPRIVSKDSKTRIDTVPLPEHTKLGKVVLTRGKYSVVVGARKIELPVGVLATEGELKKLVGKDVAVVFSATGSPSVVAIGTWPTPERSQAALRAPCYWIICYRPRPDLLRELDPAVRAAIVNDMMNRGVISRGMGRVIQRGMGR